MANIILTGANQGIGYYMAERFLAKGDSVAVLDLETGHLQELQQKYPETLRAYPCDVRDTAQVNACVQEAMGKFRTLDFAIHNACLCTFACLEETGEETYKDVLDVNYFGALRLAKAALPFLKRQGRGRLIFTSSGVGVMGFGNISPYASSKGAIEALAKCLSIEYEGTGVTVHLLHPPITRTRSSAPFPLPDAFKADPKVVGCGLADHIGAKGFVICHSLGQRLQTAGCYALSLRMGRFMNRKMAALRQPGPAGGK